MPPLWSSHAVRRAPCKDVDFFPLLKGDADDAERGANARGREGSSVALRHDLAVGGHEFRAVAADGFVSGFLFQMNLLRFFDHSSANFREVGGLRGEIGQAAFHAFDGPEEVDGGGARFG
jgi:hypothetical protein